MRLNQQALFWQGKMSNPIWHWGRVLCVLLTLALLGSCSTARLAYSNADTLAYWWLDGYVDFHSSQKTKVKRDIDQLLSWHRSTQLPQYVQVLVQMQTSLVTNPGVGELEALYRQVEQLSQVVLTRTVPELTDFLLTMDESQKAHLVRKFEKNNEEYREKYLDPKAEKQIKERRKKLLKQADDWLGSVSREQESLITRYLENHPPSYAQWLEESQSRQRLVLQLITQIKTEKPSREAAQAMVHRTILAAFEAADQNERRIRLETSRAAMQELISSVLRAASSEQKNHLRNKLQGWIDDCRDLMGRK